MVLDDGGFDDLYRTSRDRLAIQIAALTGDPSEAKDFVQEAFIRAWSKWDRISTYDDPEGWVRRVAYQLAVGRWRRSRKFVLRSAVSRSNGDSPGEGLGVIDALQTLPVAERRAIVLHHVGGLSVEETARELSAPVGTVKSWLSRGRTRLAAELGPIEEGDHVGTR
jgi:RNA polymerase sigma-70 factor (ECF subfamily)